MRLVAENVNGHTDTQTHKPSTVTLAAHARRGLIITGKSVNIIAEKTDLTRMEEEEAA